MKYIVIPGPVCVACQTEIKNPSECMLNGNGKYEHVACYDKLEAEAVACHNRIMSEEV